MSITLETFDGQLLDGLEFCAKTYQLFEALRAAPEGAKRLRSRSSLPEKRLLEELLPICRYVQTFYRLGRYISIRWTNGSQSYDAEIHQRGDYVEQGYYAPLAYLEATCAMHESEHWIWKLLNEGRGAFAPEGITKERGQPIHSEPVVFTNHEHVERFAPIVASLIQKKSAIAYPESTSLVIQCHLNSLYSLTEWRTLVSEVERAVPESPFHEVLLFDGTTERATTLAIRTA
jgi:hypothetical protein